MEPNIEMRSGMEAERAAAAERILASGHRLRAIIAGPGTGKSYIFKEALDRSGGKGLALTFIRKLARDLEEALGPRAETCTFHKYAKMLVYRLAIPGLTPDFALYPALSALTDEDIGLLRGADAPHPRLVERMMQELDESHLSGEVLRLGTYYDAASFVDVVYRVFSFLQENPEMTPEYPLVVVDEYQDFTRLETAFIAQLGFASPLLIAGDDDQALYDFRFASEEHIRALSNSPAAELHHLPFCSRCTVPVVDAVNTVVRRAVDEGRLKGRLEKPYRCYLPDKLAASERYPRLLDARCTTRDVMGRYVEAEIAKIPVEDIRASRKGKHSTVLIVGPGHFVEPMYRRLKEDKYPQAEFPHSDQLAVQPIDAYRRLARNERSNLGWRILIHLQPFDGWEEVLVDSLRADRPLVKGLPDDYRERHLAVARLVALMLGGHHLTDEERGRVADAIGVGPEDLAMVLALPEDPDDQADALAFPLEAKVEGEGEEQVEPTILCTTLPGAKGLSAEHVFVVGLLHGHFPRDNANPTDKEICEFLVALSRTRTACHLVSCKQFGAPPRGRRAPPRPPVSVFVQWVAEHCDTFDVKAGDL